MKTPNQPWVEWLGHSNFSFLQGAAHPEELLDRALGFGYRGLALTDFDGLYGTARLWRKWQERRMDRPELGAFQLFTGAEVHLKADQDRPLLLQETLALVALDAEGYHQLCRLISRSHLQGGKHRAQVDLADLLATPPQGLAVIQPMRGALRQGNGEPSAELIARLGALREHFGERFFLALSRHLHAAEDRWITPTLALSRHLGARRLCAQDPFFASPDQKDLSDLVLAMGANRPIAQIPGRLFPNARRCLHSPEALAKLYSGLPDYEQMREHSAELADQLNFDLGQLRYRYPKEMIPQGHSPQSYLEEQARQAAARLPSSVGEQIERELGLIAHLGFADYFLTVWDIVSWARSQGIVCQGRGSAANSAVCYALGITAVNPAKFDLLFERFISIERGDPPDIDVDFENARREEVIQYVYRRYGRQRAAMVCNVVTFRGRGALRFSGKALGVPEPILDRAAKRSKTLEFRSQPRGYLLGRLKEELAAEGVGMPEHLWGLWERMSNRLKGAPRHLSIHSGGFMLSDQAIDRLVPQEPASMPGRSVIQWCKDDLEALGFFKIDLLALGMLTAARKSFDLIERHYGRAMELKDIPQDDPATYEMIRRADTIGVFQIESAAQRASLPSLAPQHFYDLVVQVAIIRPGPILAGVKHPYMRRRNGLEPVAYPHPKLEPILKRTFGTIIFQEQLMRVAMAVGNFTPGEADLIRKSIGGFSSTGNLSRWLHKLIEGMVQNGIEPRFINEVMLQIQGFASYGFPESHAASFALLAYATSWLKCHYPAAFFAGLLNSQPMGFYAPDTLIKTAAKAGVEIRPISVRYSGWEADLERSESGPLALRLGMNGVKGLSESVARRIVAARSPAAPWRRLEDFLAQVPLERDQLSALAAANALADLGAQRRPALWRAEAPLYDHRLSYLPHPAEVEAPVPFGLEGEMEAVELDYRATGTSLGRHMAELIKEQAWVYPVPTEQLAGFGQLDRFRPGALVPVFGMVLVKQSPGTAKGMLFITLEDEAGTLQLAVTPQVYALFASVIDRQSFLCAYGKLQVRDGSYALLATRFFDPDHQLARVLPLKDQRRLASAQENPFKGIRSYM
ncbi:MAG: error-prone DNA polymerase [bacterium]|nr:error-prone DNA polymerase [bacterium]